MTKKEASTQRTSVFMAVRRWKPGTLVAVSAGFFGVFLAVGHAAAADYYVAPTGSDASAGSMAQPFASLQKAADTASAGDTVYFRAGTYAVSRQVRLARSGTSDTNRIKFFEYPGEAAVLDCSTYATTNRGADVPCIFVTGSWVHLKGFEIKGAPVGNSGDHSISSLRSNASNNTYELLDIHHGFGPGLFIDGGNGGNLILNCDSHDNYDKDGSQGDGQNGDGFGVHYQTTGPSTIIRGCRAWLCSDDGYDLISQEVPVRIENSWAIQNGYANGGSTSPSGGNGNGFKVGSSKTGIRHIVQNDVAWKNKAAGFYANHSSGGNTWYNNTAYMNGTQYNMLASPANDTSQTIVLTGALAHKMRNNVGFPNRNSNMTGVDSSFNTWDLMVTESNAFVSTSDTGFTGPRQADGSLPAMDFMKPRAGGPLIDAGTNVSLPYVGTAPDLGAYEFGAPTGGGGSSGAAGGGGTAGRAGASGSGGTGVAGGGAAGSGGTGVAGGAAGSGGTGVAGGAAGSGGTDVAGGSGGAGATGGSPGTAGGAGKGGVTGGVGGSTAGGTSGTSTAGAINGGAAGTGASGETSDGALDAGGCACAVGSRSTRGAMASLLALGALGLLSLRRRGHR